MRIITLHRYLLIGLTIAALPGAALATAAELRGLWVDAFGPGFKSQAQINALVSHAVAGGYNALFVEVLAYHDSGAGGHGAYFESSYVPRAADIGGSLDPLAALLGAAQPAGLEVHAWIVPFRVSTIWPPPGNSYLATRGAALMNTYGDVGIQPVSGAYVLDPGSPEVQNYLVNLVAELLDNYPVDGINLDYIRYTDDAAGYPVSASYAGSSLSRFQRRTGRSDTPAPGDSAWSSFRRDTITELVRRLQVELASRSDAPRAPLRLSADVIAFGNARDDFANSDAYRLFQDWRLWLDRGYLDLAIPMNYKREHDAMQAAWYRNWADQALRWRYDRHVAIGQGNFLNSVTNSVAQLIYARSAGADGLVSYSYSSTTDENLDGWAEFNPALFGTLGAALYAAPATPPAMPWRDPAQATAGIVWGRLVDHRNGFPVDGALVAVGASSAHTDANGYFVLTRVPAAPGGLRHVLEAAGSDCPVYTTDVTVLPAGVTRHDVRLCRGAPVVGDMDKNYVIDGNDGRALTFCLVGPNVVYGGGTCLRGDADGDQDLDLRDYAQFQRLPPGGY